MFAVVILGYVEEIFTSILEDQEIVAKANDLKQPSKRGLPPMEKSKINKVKRFMRMK